MGKRQRRALDGEIEKRTCTARKKDGTPCKRPPIKGGTVCMSHGGAAPQVRRKANERLLQGVPKMLSELKRIAFNDSIPANVRLAAIRDWLDRAGIGESDKHELLLTTPAWLEILNDEDIVVDYGADVVDGEVVDPYVDANYSARRTPVGERPTPFPSGLAGDPNPPRYTEPTP